MVSQKHVQSIMVHSGFDFKEEKFGHSIESHFGWTGQLGVNQTAMANMYCSCCSVLKISNNVSVNNLFAVLNNN